MFEFLKSMVAACKKGFAFSWLANKSIPELLLFTSTVLVPFILLTEIEGLYIIHFVCILSIILTLKHNNFFSRENHTFPFRIFSYISIGIQLLSHVFMVVVIFFNEMIQELNSTTNFFLYILVLLYLIMLLISTLAIINLCAYIILKFIFPSEIESSAPPQNISLKEISTHMTISDQIGYLVLALFNVLLITGTSIFGVELLTRYLYRRAQGDSKSVSVFSFISDEWFSIGTSIGIISVVITILSVSAPKQNEIYNEAHKKYIENSSEK